jgi:hypothetical protein
MLHDILPAARSALSCTRFSEVLRLSARHSVHAGCDLFCLNTKNSKCPLKQSRFLCMPSSPPTPPHTALTHSIIATLPLFLHQPPILPLLQTLFGVMAHGFFGSTM